MKVRLDFVTNSSSSSYIVLFTKVNKSQNNNEILSLINFINQSDFKNIDEFIDEQEIGFTDFIEILYSNKSINTDLKTDILNKITDDNLLIQFEIEWGSEDMEKYLEKLIEKQNKETNIDELSYVVLSEED